MTSLLDTSSALNFSDSVADEHVHLVGVLGVDPLQDGFRVCVEYNISHVEIQVGSDPLR